MSILKKKERAIKLKKDYTHSHNVFLYLIKIRMIYSLKKNCVHTHIHKIKQKLSSNVRVITSF